MKKIYLLSGLLFLSLAVKGICEESEVANEFVEDTEVLESEDLVADKHDKHHKDHHDKQKKHHRDDERDHERDRDRDRDDHHRHHDDHHHDDHHHDGKDHHRK